MAANITQCALFERGTDLRAPKSQMQDKELRSQVKDFLKEVPPRFTNYVVLVFNRLILYLNVHVTSLGERVYLDGCNIAVKCLLMKLARCQHDDTLAWNRWCAKLPSSLQGCNYRDLCRECQRRVIPRKDYSPYNSSDCSPVDVDQW